MATQPSNYVALPSTGGGPSTQTFEGLASGMNLALPPQELDDTSARYLQDILLDQPGLIRRRGQITTGTFPNMANKGVGVATTLDPLGNQRLGVLNGSNFSMLNSAYTAITSNFGWGSTFGTSPPSTPYPLVDIKSALGQGVWIGTSTQYDANAPTQTLGFWRGGISGNYSTGTITLTRGSATVTGSGTSWLANATPGMFLFATTDDGFTLTLVGVVQNINSDTSITLEQVSPYPATAKAYSLQSVRGFQQRVTVGNITCATSAATVTGANTKFTTQMGTGTWNIYRATDLAWIGKVSSIANNTGLTLAANAAINMNNENYIALRGDGSWGLNTSSGKVGFMNATYSELQWFANNGTSPTTTSRVWFSDATHPEDVDMSPFDGNYIDVSSSANYTSPITGMAAAYNALLVFKEAETFGIFGNSPSTFNVQKIEDDGALSTGSIQAYGGGVLWAGRTGIFFYDGVQTTNIVAGTLGHWYKELVRSINPKQYRMWSAMSRDHYFLFLEQANPTVPIVKGDLSTTQSSLCIVINMISHAPTIFTNFNIRGSVQMPFSTGLETLFLFNGRTLSETSVVGKLVSSTNVFDGTGNDTIVCDAGHFDSTTVVKSSSPSLYWKFNDRPGTTVVADYSGNSNDGIPDTGISFGQAGGLVGDGATSALSPPSPLSTDEAGGQTSSGDYHPFQANSTLTFTGWSKIVDNVHGGPVFFGSNPSSWIFLWLFNNGTTVAFSPHNVLTWANAWPGYNQWVHWAVTWNGATHVAELFINGVSKGALTADADFDPSTYSDNYVAALSDGLNGYQQDYAIFNSVLSSTAIQNIYNAGISAYTSGPDFYMESKKYNAGDSLILKLWSQLLMNYDTAGDVLNVDTVVGLNSIGATSSTQLIPTVYSWDSLKATYNTWDILKFSYSTWSTILTTVFKPRRVRFLKRSQNFAFRLWQNSSNITQVTIGPYQLGFKQMRPGRI